MDNARRTRVSASQQETIISFLANNERFKTKKFSAGFTSDDLSKLWEQLAQKLNCDGTGPTKSVDKWKKVLTDWKSNTKLKAYRIKKSLNATGGGERTTETLTDIEEQLLAIYGKELVEGIANTEEYGLSNELLVNNRVNEDVDVSVRVNCLGKSKNFPLTCAIGAQDKFNSSSSNYKIDKQTPTSSNKPSASDIYLGLENYTIEEHSESDTFEDVEVDASKTKTKKRIIEAAKNNLIKRQKRINNGKAKKSPAAAQLETTSILLENLQESQNNVYRDIASSFARHAKATEDPVLEQKELIKIKKEKNLLAQLTLANQKRMNERLLIIIETFNKMVFEEKP